MNWNERRILVSVDVVPLTDGKYKNFPKFSETFQKKISVFFGKFYENFGKFKKKILEIRVVV